MANEIVFRERNSLNLRLRFMSLQVVNHADFLVVVVVILLSLLLLFLSFFSSFDRKAT